MNKIKEYMDEIVNNEDWTIKEISVFTYENQEIIYLCGFEDDEKDFDEYDFEYTIFVNGNQFLYIGNKSSHSNCGTNIWSYNNSDGFLLVDKNLIFLDICNN